MTENIAVENENTEGTANPPKVRRCKPGAGQMMFMPVAPAFTPFVGGWCESDSEGEPGAPGPAGPAAWAQVTSWSGTEAYVAGPPASVVTYEGSTYVALTDSTGVEPGTDESVWALVAQRGEDGAGESSTVATSNGVSLRYEQTIAQSFQSGVPANMTFDSSVPGSSVPDLGYVTKSAANDSFTIQRAGIYVISATGRFSGASGSFNIAILVRGKTVTQQDKQLSSNVSVTSNITYAAQLAVGDVVTLLANQTSGATKTMEANAGNTANVTFAYVGGAVPGAWTPLPLASGYVAYNTVAAGIGGVPQYRINGDRVELRGLVGKSSGSFAAGAEVQFVTAMPTAIAPAGTHLYTACATSYVSGAGGTGRFGAHPTNMTFIASAAVPWFSLEGISYPLTS